MAERKKSAIENTVDRLFAGAALPFADLFEKDAFKDVGGLPNFKAAKKPSVGIDLVPASIYGIAKAMGAKVNSPYLDKAIDRINTAETAMREALDTPEPDNPLDLATELVGSILTPGPKGGKALRGAEKVATAASKPVKAAKVVAKTASELVIPFRQGSTALKTAPVVAAVGTGLTEGIDAVADVEEYSGIADAVKDKLPAKGTPIAGYDDDPSTPLPIPGYDVPENHIPGYDDEVDMSTVPAPDDQLSIMDKVMIGATGLATLGLASQTPRMLRALTKQRVALDGGDVVGTQFNKQSTDPITNILAGAIQSDQAVRHAVDIDAPHLAKPIRARLDLLAPASINQRTNYTLNTGQFPNSKVNIGPIGPKLNAITTSLDEDELAMLDRGMMAKSALDTIKRATLDPANPVQPALNDYTPGELRAFADVLDNDPKLKQAATEITDAYRGLAKYALDRGRISQETYDGWLKANPNYVHMSASFANSGETGFLGIGDLQFSKRASDTDIFDGRSLEEGGGVQAGAAASPLVDLPKQMRSVIRNVEQNAARVEVLDALDSGKQYGVKQVPEAGDRTISVYKNGAITHYQVPDNSLRYALEFSPTIANNAFAATGRAINSLFIQSTVGRALNPLFSLISASYEGVASAISRPKGYHLGVINEALSKKGLSIGVLDPTGGVASIPIGSLRYLWDSGIQQLANEASQAIIDDTHILARMLPDVASRQALADRLTLAYEASIKGMAQREGVFSSHIYSHEDQLKPLQGLEGIMPDFTKYANEQAAVHAMRGDTSFLEKIMAASQNANVQMNAGWFARAYNTLSNSMRESVKYQGYASNVAKITDQDSADIIASQTRRLGGDMGQRGGNVAFNTAADWSTFVNTAIQPISEIARRLKDDPAGLALNVAAVTTGSLMTQYMAAAMDPEVAEEIRNATDEQNASRIYLPGGIKIPMEQSFRPAWGPLVVLMNEISGLNDGQIDPNFVNVFRRWADEGFPIDERTKYGMGLARDAGIQSANPFHPANAPVAAAGAAAMGFDLGMSRFSDNAVTIKEPSEFGAEDRAMSNRTEKVISALVGGTLTQYMKAMMDFAAATDQGVDPAQAAKVALSRIEDKSASANGPAESLIFKGYEKVISANDTETSLMYDKRKGIDLAQQVFRDELKYPGMSGANPKVDRLLPTEAVRPEYRNTMLFPIGAVTYKLQRQLRDPIAELNMLRDVDKAIQDRTRQFSTTIEQRNAQRNALIERRRALTELVLYHIAEAEETIQQETGDPSFTYNTMDINAYKTVPYPPAPAPSPESAAPP